MTTTLSNELRRLVPSLINSSETFVPYLEDARYYYYLNASYPGRYFEIDGFATYWISSPEFVQDAGKDYESHHAQIRYVLSSHEISPDQTKSDEMPPEVRRDILEHFKCREIPWSDYGVKLTLCERI